jgi:hypothetical protein
MRILAFDVWHDLRAKRLWPVAVVLLIALIAVPLALLRGNEETGSGPAPAADAAAGLADGPTPVGIAGTSRLDRFEERDPFNHGKGIPGLEVETLGDGGKGSSEDVTVSGGGGGLSSSSSGSVTGSDLPSSGGGDSGVSSPSPGLAPSSAGTPSPPSGGTPTGGGTSGGGGGAPQPPETRFFTDEVDLRIRKPGGEVITPTSLRKLFTPLPSVDPVVLYNGVVNRDSTKLAAFVLVDPATVDRDDESCVYPSGPTTCLVFALEVGQEQRIDVGAEHYDLKVTDIRRVQVRGPE